MPTQLEKISEGLAMMAPAMGGLGAGLQGNLPQFQQVQQNQQIMDDERAAASQQAAVARMETLYKDAAAALSLARRGDYESVIKLGINRLQLLQQFPDADPSDTQRVTQLAIAARNGSEEAAELLEGELASAVQIGQSLGVIEQPERSPAVTDQGKLAQDLASGYITPEVYAQSLAGMMPERETEKDENGILRYVDTGERVFKNIDSIEPQLSEEDRFSRANTLRTELTKQNADFIDISNAWDRIAAGAENPSAAGDLSLIFQYMKMLDPASTVREGEFATAQSAAGVPTRIVGLYNRVASGERLTETQRQDFFGQAKSIFDAAKSTADQITNEYVRLGEKYGLEREDIVIDRGEAPDVSAAIGDQGIPVVTTAAERDALSPGDQYIMDGVRYIKSL